MFSKSSSLRVLFVFPAFYRNGAVNFYVNLAEELVLLGLEVKILAIEHREPHSRLPREYVKINLALGPGQSYRRESLLTLLIRLIKSTLSSDIMILTWEYGPAVKWPSRVAYFFHKPTIAIVQNNIQKSLVDYSSKNERHILRWAYAQARAIVCASKDLIASVAQEVNHKNIISISNAINVEQVRSLAKLSCSPVLTLDEIPFMVGMGRVSPQKGFDLLIRSHAAVLKKGVRHRLVLIGEGNDHATLSALAINLGVSESVIFLGFLTNPYPVLARASLFCLSSRYEGFGLVVAEAAALSVTTISTDCIAGPREILADGLYGDLVETESVEALSNDIERHFRDPERLLKKAQASAKLDDRFSMQTCAQRYSELIRHCISRSSYTN